MFSQGLVHESNWIASVLETLQADCEGFDQSNHLIEKNWFSLRKSQKDKKQNKWNIVLTLTEFIVSFPKTYKPEPLQPLHLQLCLCGTYRARCWGTWGEPSRSPQVCHLGCPPGRPSAVSRRPLLLFWDSCSYWRGMETLHIHILYVNDHEILENLLQHLHTHTQKTEQSSWAGLTWRRGRLARRSLPPCSLIVNKYKMLKRQGNESNWFV